MHIYVIYTNLMYVLVRSEVFVYLCFYQMFSEDEISKIEKDASKYNNKIIKHNVAKVFEDLVRAKRCRRLN